ncbi:MAG: 3-dehydroquinate synthase [Lachnospiraceae bacterium]|nr:3-dehydroquinate synthase [Lachnospiraceae bacterium]
MLNENNIFVKTSEDSGYDIMLRHDFSDIADALSELGYNGRRLCIVSDSNVFPLYGSGLTDALKPVSEDIYNIVFSAGEEHKNLDTVKEIYKALIKYRLDRKDLIIALGGGVTGDMAGYSAATYLRGVDFIQIPTTLLSCTDSSIGGKTGVDFDEYKNMVGAFHMPRLVYMNLSTLKTLPDTEFASGMGEIIKHGLIKDASYYEWVINNFSEINEREDDILSRMIRRSCEIKRDVVENDPTEQGERALLNFGHTIGHAIEKYMDFKLRHGECVALGTIAACFISYKRGMLSTEEFYEIRDMFVPFDLPITLPDDADAEKILALTKSDKKMSAGRIRFILLKDVGKAYIDTTVTDEEMLAGINELIIKDEE